MMSMFLYSRFTVHFMGQAPPTFQLHEDDSFTSKLILTVAIDFSHRMSETVEMKS